MSSFQKKGQRDADKFKKRVTKQHIREFYKTLNRLDEVAIQIRKSGIEITEDNIEEEASKVIGRNIDSMEKFLLLGKLGSYDSKE